MDVTLSNLFQEYSIYKRAKNVTKAKAKAAFGHLVQFAGDVPARDLSAGRINKWSVWLETQAVNIHTGKPGLSRFTVKTTIGAAAQVFGWALRQRDTEDRCEYGLARNPFEDAEPVPVGQRLVRFYAVDEVRDILAAASEMRWHDRWKALAWYCAILMAAKAGYRKGEILNWRWEDLDADHGRLWIRHREDVFGRQWAWQSKGDHEDSVPMGDTLWAALMRLQWVRPWRYPFIAKQRYLNLVAGLPRHGVVTWPLPEKVRDCPSHNWTRQYNAILARANRRRQAGGRPTIKAGDFHQLRKSLGTWLADAGVPEHWVQATLRHASPDTTRQFYVGINHRDCESRVRQAINEIDL